MAATTAIDLILGAFRNLSAEEQDDCWKRLRLVRLDQMTFDDSELQRLARGLRRIAEEVGQEPSASEFHTARKKLVAAGEDIATMKQLLKRFGSWKQAKAVLLLADDDKLGIVDARYRRRRAGRTARFTDATVLDFLRRCGEELGHPPMLSEYNAWRERELEKASVRGETLRIPSPGAIRYRWARWREALLKAGFKAEAIDAIYEEAEARAIAAHSRMVAPRLDG